MTRSSARAAQSLAPSRHLFTLGQRVRIPSLRCEGIVMGISIYLDMPDLFMVRTVRGDVLRESYFAGSALRAVKA